MYSREETKRIKEKFWTTFGQYMSPIPSAEGEKVKWINYKTGIKFIHFKMDATNKNALIMIEISHPDERIRLLIFEQFLSLRTILHHNLDEEWNWESQSLDHYDRPSAQIFMKIDHVNIFNEAHWPTLISFFKPRLLALDAFWSDAKDVFADFT